MSGAGTTLFPLEVFDLIGATTVLGVLYGITFTLYCLCARSLYLKLQKPDKRRQAGVTLGYISLLFFCATGFLSVNGRLIKVAYIDHGDFPGGPLAYEFSYNSTISAYDTAGSIFDSIIEILTMAIQVQRLWIIWRGTRYAAAVTIPPLLLLLSYIALDIPGEIVISFVQLDQHGISHRTIMAMLAAIYAIMSSLTIFVTGLIATRLLLARRQHMKIMGTSEGTTPYLSIVAMLVESYALDSAWSLATAISFALETPILLMFAANDSTIKIIAYFLVIYRVETGRGWTKKTEAKLTSLQWNRGAQTTTDEASSTQFRVPAAMRGVDSPPVTHSDSVA